MRSGLDWLGPLPTGGLVVSAKPIRRGSIVTCKIGNYGERGYRRSVPVRIKDIVELAHGQREYWFEVLGLCVVGKAHKTESHKDKTDLFCSIRNHVAYAGQMPLIKGVETQTDALAYIGYYDRSEK